MKDFYRREGAGIRKLYQAKKWVDYCKVTSVQVKAEVYQVDSLSSADQEIPDWLVQDFITGKVETVTVKSQFGDMELSISNSILSPLSCF